MLYSLVFLYLLPVFSAVTAQQYGNCKATSGQDGECISTAQCSSLGGVSDPARLCPGPNNIQCCTYGTCKATNGLPGECIPTSSCQNARGTSDSAHLCKGGNNIQCCTYGTCKNSQNVPGECITTNQCGRASGTSDPGNFCPGDNDVQCCTYRGCTNSKGQAGQCQPVSTCTGTSDPGNFCPGGSEIQCCTSGTTPPPPPPAGGNIPGFDVSMDTTTAFWNCMKPNYKKVCIRGYRQACDSGGAVDTAFLNSYRLAVAAGFSVDAYFFPCTGTQPGGDTCKTPQAQISEFENYIRANNMQFVHLWFDVEQSNGACNSFNLSPSANEAAAKQFTAIMRSSAFKWGVYGNCNTWTNMFPSRATDIGSDLPFWAVQDDHAPGVNTVNTFCGGWTVASAKQYNDEHSECGLMADLDTFST